MTFGTFFLCPFFCNAPGMRLMTGQAIRLKIRQMPGVFGSLDLGMTTQTIFAGYQVFFRMGGVTFSAIELFHRGIRCVLSTVDLKNEGSPEWQFISGFTFTVNTQPKRLSPCCSIVNMTSSYLASDLISRFFKSIVDSTYDLTRERFCQTNIWIKDVYVLRVEGIAAYRELALPHRMLARSCQ